MLKHLSLLLSLSLIVLLTSCSSENFVDHVEFNHDSQNNHLQFKLVLGENLDLPGNISLPIEDYGKLELFQAFQNKNAEFILTAYLNKITEVPGNTVWTLPNGAEFPAYVDAPLIEVPFAERYFLYISPKTFRYLGFAMLIPEIDNALPEEFIFVSPFVNDDEDIMAVASVQGPRKLTTGEKKNSLIFAIADMSVILDDLTYFEIIKHIYYTGECSMNQYINFSEEDMEILRKAGYLK